MHQHQVVITASRLFQAIDTIVDRLLTIASAREYPFQLGNAELVGIRLQYRFPTCQTYHSNTLNIRMLLKSHHRMDDDRTVVYMHKLLWDVLSHSVARTSGYDQCIVHILYL